jgi:hypothetical protein
MNKLTQRKKAKVDEMYKLIGSKPSLPTPKIPSVYMVTLTEQFLIGLIDGDGSFYVSFTTKGVVKFGVNIVGSLQDQPLFNAVKDLLGCGTVKPKSETVSRYDLESIVAIENIMIPFIDKYQLHTHKAITQRLNKHWLYIELKYIKLKQA